MNTYARWIAVMLLLATVQGCAPAVLVAQFYETAIIAVHTASTATSIPAELMQPAILLNDMYAALAGSDSD